LMFGQITTVLLALGMLVGGDYPMAQLMVTTTAVCFGFGFSNPALSAAASNATNVASMGGTLGMVQGFAALGQVGGLVIAGPLYQLGGSQFPFSFGAAVTACLLVVVIVILKRRPALTIS